MENKFQKSVNYYCEAQKKVLKNDKTKGKYLQGMCNCESACKCLQWAWKLLYGRFMNEKASRTQHDREYFHLFIEWIWCLL